VATQVVDRSAIQRAPSKPIALKLALKLAPAALAPPELRGFPAFASQLALPVDRGAIHDFGGSPPSGTSPCALDLGEGF